MSHTLTLIDTIGIQDYIFSSNRLRENIGASQLVECTIKHWAYQSIDTVADKHNIDTNKSNAVDWTLKPATDELDLSYQAQVIYSGGGNTAILFDSEERAKRFAGVHSLRLLQDAPGLTLALVHHSFDQTASLAETVREALRKMNDAKRNRPLGVPLLGLSVSAECQSTGLPAVGLDPIPLEDEANRLVSAEVAAKVSAKNDANTRLRKLMPEDINNKYLIPEQFDDLARLKGESSYIAVVHADGNGIGRRVIALAKAFAAPEQNGAYVKAMRTFSDSIEDASRAALSDCMTFLDSHVLFDKNNWWIDDKVPLALGSSSDQPCKPFLPFRPLVFGGDDVTFVCNGQIGLAMGLYYLKRFEQQPLEDGQASKQPRACAGISVVKQHYPFARAYGLSEELCDSAKCLVQSVQSVDGASALDWHFSTTGLSGDLDLIRKREYTRHDTSNGASATKRLHLRPVFMAEAVASEASKYNTWPVVSDLMLAFQSDWASKRNKVKRLREALREGEQAVRQFTQGIEGGKLPTRQGMPADVETSGWDDKQCLYFDAIEAMDYALLLDKLEDKEEAA